MSVSSSTKRNYAASPPTLAMTAGSSSRSRSGTTSGPPPTCIRCHRRSRRCRTSRLVFSTVRLFSSMTWTPRNDSRSGDGLAVDLAGAAFEPGRCDLGRGESEALVEDAGPARGSARMVGAEGHHLYYARISHEPAYRLRNQDAADPLPSRLLTDHEPAHVIDRRGCTKKQAAQQFVVAGDCDQGCGPADVLAKRGMKARLAGHGTEPVLDLSRQVDEPMHVLLGSEPDDHRNSQTAISTTEAASPSISGTLLASSRAPFAVQRQHVGDRPVAGRRDA